MNARSPQDAIVHIVDDDESVRVAMARLLRAAGYEAQSYASAGEFLLQRTDDTCGCLILDVKMPGPSGLDLQGAMVRQNCPMPIIFVTAHGDVSMSVRAMKAGAVDFLLKPVKREDLLAAVRAAMQLATEMRSNREQQHEWHSRLEALTPREREVLGQVVAGKLNKQIAADLGTAERTVKAHRAQVMEKMRVSSLAELVQLVDRMAARTAHRSAN